MEFVTFWPIIYTIALTGSLIYFYFKRDVKKYLWISGLIIACKLIQAASLTAAQYIVWSKQPFTKTLLNLPLDPSSPSLLAKIPFFLNHHLGYFTYYALTRFWLPILIGIISGFAVYGLFKLLKKIKGSGFENGDTELTLCAGLLVGWPGSGLLVVLTLLIAIVITTIQTLRKKTTATTPLSIPLLISLCIVLLFGLKLLPLLNLDTLKL